MTDESESRSDPLAPEAEAEVDVAAGPSAPASKSIYLYFGGGPASSSTSVSTPPSASVGEPSQPKKRRKKGGQDEKQARFLRNGGEGGWLLGKHDEATASGSETGETATTGTGTTRGKGTVRGRGRGTGIGTGTARKAGGEEEAEVRDMVQRGRGGRRGGKSRQGQVGARNADAPGSDGDDGDDARAGMQADAFDSSTIPGPEADSPSPSGSTSTSPNPNPSPAERKRGRPRKVLPEIPTPNQPVISPPISSSAVVDPTSSRHPDPPPIAHRSSSPSDIVFTGHLRPERPERDRPERGAHPFFSRTASSSGSNKGVSQADPIDVDVDVDVDEPIPLPLPSGPLEVPPAPGSAPVARSGPRKLAFASDAKPAHTFFSRVAEASGVGTSRATSVVSETATEVSVSVPGLGTESKGRKVHAFFKMNGQGKLGGLKDGWGGGVKEGKEWLVPWPGRVWPTHIGAEPTRPSQIVSPGLGTLTRRNPGPLDEDDFWTSHAAIGTSETDPVASEPVPNEQSRLPIVGDHPAISSVKSRPRGSDRRTWCERYRPTRACEVLGNELEATYLRDWLSALTVGHKDASGHGPRVSRKIKRRKAQAFDDWIVDDLGGYGDPREEDSEDEDFETIEDPPLSFAGRPNRYPPFEHRLGNAILLTGPQGSGKSAAVYAAAEELGWEVFEIYPGIGKRTGGNVMSWVGDVGKNHMVVTSKEVDKGKDGPQVKAQAEAQAQNGDSDREKRNKGGLQSFFGRKADLSRETTPVIGFGSQGSQAEPIEVDDDMEVQHAEHAEHAQVTDGAKTRFGEVEDDESSFRQSVILLDEVDILFEEEATFWPAVVSLIATSHRPVILTCNDPQRVPLAQLPLQAILQFEPPASHLANPYLEAIAEHEGLTHCDIPAVVKRCTTAPLELLDRPLPPNGHEPMPVFDLRRAIQQMQLDRGAAQSYSSASRGLRSRSRSESTGDCGDHPDSLESLTRRLDTQSFVDAFVAERPWALMEISEVDRYSRTTDDVLDTSLLLKPEPKEWRPTLAAYDHAPTIASTLLQLAGEPLPSWGNLQTDRTEYIRSLLVLLDPIVPLSSPLLPRPSVFLDLLPIVRTMILTDDILQGAEDAAVAMGAERTNRKTGRPVRAGAGKGYDRYLDLGEGALGVARTLGLIFEQNGAK